jgi:hypothetical protein
METVVRKAMCVGAMLLATLTPARAQYGAPFGGAGMLTSPEAASGAFGAGAAHSTVQQQCYQRPQGRGGAQTVCDPNSEPSDHRR